MQEEKVKEIVSLVMKELQDHLSQEDKMGSQKLADSFDSSEEAKENQPSVQLYGESKHIQTEVKAAPKVEGIIPLYQASQNAPSKVTKSQEDDVVHDDSSPVELLDEKDYLIEKPHAYVKHTPARVAVGRAGPRPKTKTLLKFRYDHAAAVDAVYGEVDQDILDSLNLFTVNTKVEEKEVYIRRPDLGRRFTEESKKTIQEKCKSSPTVQIIASNGLSASAINENLKDVYLSLEQSLKNLNIEMGTPFYVNEGRVGIMDDVGEILSPDVVINLIGERPGLVSAESLSAYLCYKPKHGMIESDRMVISNIHKGGIPPIEAGAYLGTVVERILKHKASGVKLIQKEG